MATTQRPPVPTTHDEWLEAYGATPERDAEFLSLSGEPVRALYTEADLPAEREAGIGFRVAIRSHAGCIRRCIAGGCGRCGSSPGSGPRRRPTSASTTSS